MRQKSGEKSEVEAKEKKRSKEIEFFWMSKKKSNFVVGSGEERINRMRRDEKIRRKMTWLGLLEIDAGRA